MLQQGKSIFLFWGLEFHLIKIYVNFHKFGFLDFRAYDRAAIKFRGVDADINFSITDYEEDMKQVSYS